MDKRYISSLKRFIPLSRQIKLSNNQPSSPLTLPRSNRHDPIQQALSLQIEIPSTGRKTETFVSEIRGPTPFHTATTAAYNVYLQIEVVYGVWVHDDGGILQSNL
jgi:hypothetical protein